jgi:hypothetical protein
LETLNIFGVKADYIAQFKKELEDEDIPVNDGLQEFVLPLQPMPHLPKNLNVIRIKPAIANKALGGAGTAFKELAEQVELKAPEALSPSERSYFYDPPRVKVDFYPRVGQFATEDKTRIVDAQEQKLGPMHTALLDTRRLYFELLAFKRDRRWANLALTPDVVDDLLADTGWYALYAPDDAMALGQLEKMTLWHDMAASLLRKYCDMFYGLRRKQWEGDKLEYRSITENTDYLPGAGQDTPKGSHVITLDTGGDDSPLKQLEGLRNKLKNGDVAGWNGQVVKGLEFIWCERHFYQPLLADAQRVPFDVSPVPLNTGEATFVKDVQQAIKDGVFGDYEVYLLRNQTGQGAVGVFIDGGFYPDFILWLVKGNTQKVVFVDPKGLRNHQPDDPKVQFHRTIKDTERQLNQQPGGQSIELHAFLISQTHPQQLLGQWREYQGQKLTKDKLENWNILFPQDGNEYLQKLAEKVQ